MLVRKVALAAALVASVGTQATACAPVNVFVVNSFALGSDAVPGDGECRTTVPFECTLEAAVAEANALGSATITVPPGEYAADTDISISGSVHIDGGAPGSVILNNGFTVEASGVLGLHGVTMGNSPFAPTSITVHGVLVATQISIARAGLPTVAVGETGAALIENSYVGGALGAAAMVNEGDVVARHVTFDGSFGSPAIDTTGSGETTLASSLVVGDWVGCSGTAPTSGGFNHVDDLSCSLSATGDVEGVNAGTSQNPAFPNRPVTLIAPSSPAIDAIPAGFNGCGTEVTVDELDNPRPVDGNGDTVAACDKGADEYIPPT